MDYLIYVSSDSSMVEGTYLPKKTSILNTDFDDVASGSYFLHNIEFKFMFIYVPSVTIKIVSSHFNPGPDPPTSNSEENFSIKRKKNEEEKLRKTLLVIGSYGKN